MSILIETSLAMLSFVCPDILELGRAGRSGRRKGKKVTSKPPKTFKVENSSGQW